MNAAEDRTAKRPVVIACVWVKGNVDYSADYVVRLLSMVGRHIDRPFGFVCLTDRPHLLPTFVNTVEIQSPPPPLQGWWAKLELFSPARTWPAGRIVYLDLDSLIVGGLQPILDFPAALALVPAGGAFQPKGFRTVRRFNSSVMAFDAGTASDLFLEFYGSRGRLEMRGSKAPLWGDQDWIGLLRPTAATMPAEWFPRLSELRTHPPSAMDLHSALKPAKVVLCKTPKPHVAAATIPFVAETWR